MPLAQDIFTAAFPKFGVATAARPDGGLLISLSTTRQGTIRRALTRSQINSRKELEWVVSAIQRDLALEAGMAPAITQLQSQSRVALPTYEYA